MIESECLEFWSYERFRTFDCCSALVRPIAASLGQVVSGVNTTIPPSFKLLRLTVWCA